MILCQIVLEKNTLLKKIQIEMLVVYYVSSFDLNFKSQKKKWEQYQIS